MAATSALIPIISAATALVASGGIATLSLFDIPELQSQPASRSLPSIRWLFSRGSHIFPTAAFMSGAGFVWSAYAALPPSTTTLKALAQLLQFGANAPKVNSFLLAAALAISIGPMTRVMIPTNFALIKLNEELGGYRSAKAAGENRSSVVAGQRSAEDSVAGKGEGNQFTDLSIPQEVTERKSTSAEDEKTRELLGKFGKLNLVRAVLLGAGGVVGLYSMVL